MTSMYIACSIHASSIIHTACFSIAAMLYISHCESEVSSYTQHVFL